MLPADDDCVFHLVVDVASTAARHTASHFEAAEGRLDKVEENAEHTKSKIAALQVGLSENQRELQQLRKLVEERPAASTSVSGSASVSGAGSQHTGPRTCARLGGLGLDVPELDLVTRAKECLERSNVAA